MSNKFASGKRAVALCDFCGQRYPLRKLKSTIVKGKLTNLLACPTDWSPDHPQLWVGVFPVDDPQALRNPRPDTNLDDSRGLFAWNPTATQQVTCTINNIFIEVT